MVVIALKARFFSFGHAREQTEALPSRPESLRNSLRSCARDRDATENGGFKKRSKSRLTSAVLGLVRAWSVTQVQGANRCQSKRKIISMQNNVPSSTAVRQNFVLAPPSCPTCKSGMRLVKATPIVLTPDLIDVSYV